MSMLSRWTIGAMASKKASAVSPVSAAIASASAGEVSGPVATMTLSHSAGGRPAISPRGNLDQRMARERRGDGLRKAVAVDGERAAGRHLVGVGRAHHQRAEPPHLLVQQADRVVLAVIGAERVRADELGEAVGLVDRGRAPGPHLVQHDGHAAGGDLPSGLAPGKAAADDMDGLHRNRGYWKYLGSQPRSPRPPGGTPEEPMRNTLSTVACATFAVACALGAAVTASHATDLKVLTAGAFKSTVVALAPEYEKASGNKLIIDNDTVGGLVKRVEGGETFDVIVLSPAAIDELAAKSKVAPFSRTNLARVGVGVMVKEGAPKPDISTVDAFKKAVLDAKSVSFINPASGGSSGIYVEKLLEKLGIADQVKPKEKLKDGGYVADLILSGEAELGIHQISEIVPHKGVTFVGPLPDPIQNYTVYAAGCRSQHQVSGRGEEGDRGVQRAVGAGPVQVQGDGTGPLRRPGGPSGSCHQTVVIAR